MLLATSLYVRGNGLTWLHIPVPEEEPAGTTAGER